MHIVEQSTNEMYRLLWNVGMLDTAFVDTCKRPSGYHGAFSFLLLPIILSFPFRSNDIWTMLNFAWEEREEQAGGWNLGKIQGAAKFIYMCWNARIKTAPKSSCDAITFTNSILSCSEINFNDSGILTQLHIPTCITCHFHVLVRNIQSESWCRFWKCIAAKSISPLLSIRHICINILAGHWKSQSAVT